MYIPPGMTEEQVLAAIEKVVSSLAAKFRFGYYEIDDMRQEARAKAIQLINEKKYDTSRPLENFLYTHVRNRLLNFKRDNYKRSEPPCINCPFYDKFCKKSTNQCAEFTNKDDCKKFSNWNARNKAKQGLMHPVDISSIFDERLSNGRSAENEVEFREIVGIIESQLPESLVSVWNKARNHEKLHKAEKEKLQKFILRVFKHGTDKE
jgi:Sigma-70 region 2